MRLSRRRRREEKPASRHMSLSATDAEWDAVRARAEGRGLSIARYLVGLAERDGAAEPGPWMTLSAEEQRELLAAMREVRAMAVEEVSPAPADPPGDASPGDTADPAGPGGARQERLL